MFQRLKKFVLPMALFLALIFVLGIFLAFRGVRTLQWGMAETLRWQSECLVRRFNIDSTLHERIVEIVEQAAKQIESGDFWFWKGAGILRAFNDGPVFYSLLHLGLSKRLNELGSGSVANVAISTDLCNRFFAAAAAGKVDSEILNSVREILVEEVSVSIGTPVGLVIPEKLEVFKDSLTEEEIERCSKMMGDVCANASLDEHLAAPDVLVELKKVVASL